MVTSVENGSQAEDKGIKIGDRLMSVNGKQLFGTEDLKIKIKQSAAEELKLQLEDGDGVYNVFLQPENSL